ncbi:MAG TPA: lysophospholipid acyltransferase family protein [Candidatus Binatia bacterium]|nr:lysophospholipid acyltransferase family protein [Candidatus Binatia bacterium]
MVVLVARKQGVTGPGMVLRSLFFNLAYGLWTGAMHIVCLPLLLGPARWTHAAATLWIDVTLWLLKNVVGLDHRIVGAENLPDRPAIFAAKHQSAWETLFLSRYLNFPAFILKRELLQIPLFGWFIRKAGMIAVDRSAGANALRQMSRQASEVFDQGRSILIFPEGTRVAPGEHRHYHPGVAALYTQLKVPVVPVALNSGLFWARKAFVKKPGTIVVEILPPIPPGLDRKGLMKELESRIETAAVALARTADSGYRKQR